MLLQVSYERMPQTQARWAMAGWDAVDEARAEQKLLNVRLLQAQRDLGHRKGSIV